MKKYFDYKTETVRLEQLFMDFAEGRIEIPKFQRQLVWEKTSLNSTLNPFLLATRRRLSL